MQRFKFAENRIFSVDGHPFLFLTEENAIFEMAADLEAFVKGATPLRPQPLSQLMDRLGGTEAEKRELVNALLKGRVLVPEAAAPLMVLDFLNSFQDETVALGERKRLLRSTLPALRQRCQRAPILVSIRKEVPEFMEMLGEAADDVWRAETPPQPPVQMTLGIEF